MQLCWVLHLQKDPAQALAFVSPLQGLEVMEHKEKAHMTTV